MCRPHLSLSGSILSLVLCGCGGFNGIVAPTLSSIDPTTIVAGGAAFTLTATGTGFVNGTTLLWDGAALATTVKSSTQLTAAVSAQQISTARAVVIRAMKPDTTTSGALSLTITGTPSFTLTSISPSAVTAGSASFTLTATGTGFVSGASIALNGAALSTTFDSATQLHATVAAPVVASAATIGLSVTNPDKSVTNTLPLTVTGSSIPAPTLTSITPNTSPSGITSPLTLTTTGTNYVNGSTVMWNGAAVATAFVSTTQLAASIPASYFVDTNIGTANVSVLNPNHTSSSALPFTITVSAATTPVLTSILPTSSSVGDAGLTLTLYGTLFAPNATAYFGNLALTTTVINSSQATAQVPASVLTRVAEVAVTIKNTQSDPSNSIPYMVGITLDPGEVNDLAWDAQRNVLYLSRPSTSLLQPDTVIAIDPLDPSATPLWTYSPGSGSDPDRLALSADSKFLYVGLDGNGTVQQLALGDASPVPGNAISLGSDAGLNPYFAIDLQVSPNDPNTIAVARGTTDPLRIEVAIGGVAVYDNAIQRPQVVDPATQPVHALLDTIQWSADGNTIYAANNETASGDFYKLDVLLNGVALADGNDYPGIFPLANPYIHLDSTTGFLYGDDGQYLNTALAPKADSFIGNGIMTPDQGTATAYFVVHPANDSNVMEYALLTYTLTANPAPGPSVVLYQVQGIPQHIVHWSNTGIGISGLAFSTRKITCFASPCNAGDGALYIVTLPLQ